MAGLEIYVSIDADDIAEGWRTLDDEAQEAAEVLILRAEPILLSQSPGLLDRLAAGTTPPEAVEQVIIQAVRRALLPSIVNPDGAKRSSKSIDDYQETAEWDAAQLAAGLYYTGSELALVAGSRPARRGRAFVIDTTPRY